MTARTKKRNALPGFGLSTGFTVLYLGLLVLVPLSTLFWKSSSLGWAGFWQAVSSPRVVASYELTFGTALVMFARFESIHDVSAVHEGEGTSTAPRSAADDRRDCRASGGLEDHCVLLGRRHAQAGSMPESKGRRARAR